MAIASQSPLFPSLQAHSADVITFEAFELPRSNQRTLAAPHPPETTTPLALRPADQQKVSLDSAIETVKLLQAERLLTSKLSQHGVILFRGLPIKDAHDFSRFAHSFGFKPHEIIGIVVNRTVSFYVTEDSDSSEKPLAANVAPANEAPKEVLIYNHNESPQVPHAPEYIFFYGNKVPKSGGETPISSSLELYARAQREIPEFINDIVAKGILSKITYKLDKQYEGGSTLREAFGKEIQDGDNQETQKKKIEAQILRYGRGKFTTWEWTEDGITLTHRLPAVRTQPRTNLPSLFTGLAAYYKRYEDSIRENARANVVQQLYGDGTPISSEHLKKLTEITDDIRVLHKWQEGDVLVYDNIIAQHGREPWQGEKEDRVVLASLWDGDDIPGPFGFGEWAQVVQALDLQQ